MSKQEPSSVTNTKKIIPHAISQLNPRKRTIDRCQINGDLKLQQMLIHETGIHPIVKFYPSTTESGRWTGKTLAVDKMSEHLCHSDAGLECNQMYFVSNHGGYFDFVLCYDCYENFMHKKHLHSLASIYQTTTDIWANNTFINARHVHLAGHIHCQYCGYDCINWGNCILQDLLQVDEVYHIGSFRPT